MRLAFATVISKVPFPGIVVLLAAAQTAPDAPQGPIQPLPFSHKTHVSSGLACRDCHATADRGEAAGFPALSKCMACHTAVAKDRPSIVKLAELYKKQEPIPWKRVYRVPDYVAFSHKTHVGTAHVACDTCHGSVQDRDVIRKEKPTSMAACVDCHKQNGASVACDYCHEPR